MIAFIQDMAPDESVSLISKMAILCLCGKVYKPGVFSHSAIFLVCMRINVVERSIYV